jgi:hypothetical protein
MAIIRLVPSTSAVSNSSYAAVANASNMYTNTDSTTYGTFTHNRASTNNTYYGYLRGFNFSDVPEAAVVSSFTIKIKASATGHTTSTSSSYYMSLINNTTQIGSTTASGRLSTTVTTFTFANGSLDWDTIKSYGSNFGIRIPMRRASSNTADVVSIYGAEIEVTYTIPNPRTVTTTLNGNGTIDPQGTETYYDGDEYNLVVTPNNTADTVTATKNGTAITLTQHQGGSTTESNVLGAYALVSGSFNGSGATYFQGIVGHGYDTSTTTTSNYYSGGNGTIAVFTYDVPFTDIPNNATITSLYMRVNGHAESTSQSSEYMCAQLISGSTALSDELNFKDIGTSNSTQTVTANVTPTVAQLENLKVQCRLGYYGGAINGATVYLEYEVSGVYYTYSTTVTGDMSIAVTIGNVTTYTVNASSEVTRVTVTPATQSQAEGGSAVVRFDTNTLNNIIVKDNNADVTSQLVSHTESGSSDTNTYIPSSFDSTNSSYDSVYSTNVPENGLTAHTSTTRCCVYAHTANDSESYLYYNFDCSDIPSNAIITSVSCQVGASCYSSGSYFSTHTLQLCTGTTEKGTAVTTTGNGSTSAVQTVDGGSSWTRAELDNIKIRFKIVRGETGDASFSFFGATLTVEYTLPATTYWTYTISNLQTDHTVIVISAGGSDEIIYVKLNGTWTQFSKVYKKINGSWVEQASSTWPTLFNTSTSYRKMN